MAIKLKILLFWILAKSNIYDVTKLILPEVFVNTKGIPSFLATKKLGLFQRVSIARDA